MNTEQERAEFEAFASKHGLCVTEDGDLYRSHVVAWMWKAWQARAALQSQDDDIFSPTSLTGLSKDELIRQLQWALDYWMPAIASEDTPDGNRSARDARLLMGMKQPTGREEENTPAYWEKVKALQSQDAERLQAAARDMFVRAREIEILYGTNKETEGLVNAAIWLAHLVGPSEQSIDHARRAREGG